MRTKSANPKLVADPKLVAEVMRLGKFKTKREALDGALTEFIRWKEQLGVTELFGKIEWDPSYDYKALRSYKRK